ncbi:MAG: hypothetical protein UT55_C0008G0007 [Candidatus Peregrinibacteria bacterium GW2011_GWE2_39_6]|nr:MAG: hypothetical protein UT36_C0002G0063 [Candidatus Peregrinibacteria bacterium GW2011_GWF2_39_17]KKR26416.1 MAG: hypothetical protein UT55_C0008G0007 [Candidatus Peregrinibacteria bacterium GW2011_GWE2_39_6]HCW32167.1 hypothetical protein [Candidatus Peregrinibacteria bacterium]
MNDPYYRNRLRQSAKARTSAKRFRPLSEEIRIASRMLIFTIIGLFVFSLVGFLLINSSRAAKGAELSQLQAAYEQLLLENRKLQRQLTEAQSLSSLENAGSFNDLIRPNDQSINYMGNADDLADANL